MIRIWFLTALGMWLTPIAASLAATFGNAGSETHWGMTILLAVLIILFGGGFILHHHRLSTFMASLTGVMLVILFGLCLSAFCSLTAIATLFGVTGAMYALSALLSLFLGWNPGCRWLLLLMAASGLMIAVIVNSLLENPLSLWLTSILVVLAWPAATFYKLDTLEALPRKLYNGEFSTPSRCMVLGAIMLYFSTFDLLAQILMLLVRYIYRSDIGIWWW